MGKNLVLENICKTFYAGDIKGGVEDINFQIAQGEGFSILGPSGCGKTTTLRIIGGFECPDSGKVLHGGLDITNLAPQERNIRTVFQKYALFPHLSVFENIAFGLRTQKTPTAEVQKRVASIAELIEIPHLLKRAIVQLSGGEQQRVALARALVTEPEVLLLDEPLSALDLKLRERMQLELLSLRHRLGSTFIFVTHDQVEAMTLSDRIAVMSKGKVEQIGTPQEIYSCPKSKFVASFIGQANFLLREHTNIFKGDTHLLAALPSQSEWMLRPENLTARSLKGKLPQGHIAMTVKILESAFLGQDRLTKVIDPLGKQHLVKTPGHEPALGETNQDVYLLWEPEDMWSVLSDS